MTDNEKMLDKIDSISEIVKLDLLEYVSKETDVVTQSFIVAEVLANLVGWYGVVLNELHPPLVEHFDTMIERNKEVYQNFYKEK